MTDDETKPIDPPAWELTIAECANLTGRDPQMIRWFIKNKVLQARKVTGVQRPYWLIDAMTLSELVKRDRPKRPGPQPKWLTGKERTDSLGFKPANPDHATDTNQPDEPVSEGG